jgi:hypothetical protein
MMDLEAGTDRDREVHFEADRQRVAEAILWLVGA